MNLKYWQISITQVDDFNALTKISAVRVRIKPKKGKGFACTKD